MVLGFDPLERVLPAFSPSSVPFSMKMASGAGWAVSAFVHWKLIRLRSTRPRRPSRRKEEGIWEDEKTAKLDQKKKMISKSLSCILSASILFWWSKITQSINNYSINHVNNAAVRAHAQMVLPTM